ncbi:MAG: FAD-dependent oxidoreductase [Gemmatimonadetes bacterium]|nr:FAD-dependent oxidoreductase [Gemmatimonadota bacterium]
MTEHEYDLVAIGGGTAGLVSAAGARYIGATSAIVEREALGGDCLWTGCVPSKALVASARLAHAMRHAEELGLTGAAPRHAFGEVMARMRAARDTVAHHDDPERFRGMGVGVHFGAARFLEPGVVEVEGVGRIRSKRFVVATGALPSIPPIPGLEDVSPLTHHTAFDIDELPRRMVILGGGPIGLEFAQAYARLGARVTVVELLDHVLAGEDPDVSAALRELLEAEDIEIVTGERAERVEKGERGGSVVVTASGRRFETDALFVATGRRPATEGLELARAGIETDDRDAVVVDDRLRTTGDRVWAAGDVTGGAQFTHLADAMAKTVLRDALLPFGTRLDRSAVPRVTYTDPEVAHVGMGEREAEDGGASTHRYAFADLDRAIVEGDARGFVKIHADRKGRVMGATVLGAGAGELIVPLVMAMKHGLSLGQISDTIFPYPTRMEGVKRAADAFRRTRIESLGGKALRKVVSWLA